MALENWRNLFPEKISIRIPNDDGNEGSSTRTIACECSDGRIWYGNNIRQGYYYFWRWCWWRCTMGSLMTAMDSMVNTQLFGWMSSWITGWCTACDLSLKQCADRTISVRVCKDKT